MKFTDESKTSIIGKAKPLGTANFDNIAEDIKVFNGVSGAFMGFDELNTVLKSGNIKDEYAMHVAYGIRKCEVFNADVMITANLDLNSPKGMLLKRHIEELGDKANNLYFLIRYRGDNKSMVALDIIVREDGTNN